MLKTTSDSHATSCASHTEKWYELIKSIPHPVCIIDTDYRIIIANNDFYSLCGNLPIDQNLNFYRLFHNTDGPGEDCPLQRCIKSGNREEAHIYEPHLGREIIIRTSPLLEKGSISAVMHCTIDITNETNRDLLEVYSSAISEMKSRELRAKHGKDAFFNMLEDINESYEELEDLFLKLVRVMVNSLDAKSPWTKGHSVRVSEYAEKIAREMSIDEEDIKDIKLAGLLHDIGKIGTSDYLLDKPGALTKDEFTQIKKHPSQGADILKDIKQLRAIIPYIKYHHEKLDGTGYPSKLTGPEIPLGAKILHVADSFDSMTSDRPYRPSPGLAFALKELETNKGTQFDAEVVEAFLHILSRSQQFPG